MSVPHSLIFSGLVLEEILSYLSCDDIYSLCCIDTDTGCRVRSSLEWKNRQCHDHLTSLIFRSRNELVLPYFEKFPSHVVLLEDILLALDNKNKKLSRCFQRLQPGLFKKALGAPSLRKNSTVKNFQRSYQEPVVFRPKRNHKRKRSSSKEQALRDKEDVPR